MQPVTVPNPPPLAIPPVIPDGEVIVPPTPTKQLLPLSETDGLTSGAVQPPGSTGENLNRTPTTLYDKSHVHDASDDSDSSFSDEGEFNEAILINQAEDEEQRLIKSGGTGIPIDAVSCLSICALCILPSTFWTAQDGQPKPLLPPIAPQHVGRKCLVLDLDETLVHSSLKVGAILTLSTLVLTLAPGRALARLHSPGRNRGILAQLLRIKTPGRG